jgi:ADP-heptose:LPS heptosyltransferase
MLTFKHSGDIGDLIYSLPVIRHYGEGILYLNPRGIGIKQDGMRSGLNHKTIKSLTPLLMQQPYIKDVKVYKGQVTFVDLDAFRVVGQTTVREQLCAACCNPFGVPVPQKAWIQCGEKKIAPVVVNRTFNYRNHSIDIEKTWRECLAMHNNEAVFVGTPEEHCSFIRDIVVIPYYETPTMLDLAEVINGADVFMGNQSSPMAVAIALDKPFIQEVSQDMPNCIFRRPNAVYLK